MFRFPAIISMFTLIAAAPTAALAKRPHEKTARVEPDVSDEALVRDLPGFRNARAEVNGVRLHYVVGGTGTPVVLMPGWPQTWWAFHKIMPTLARSHRVIAVDIRGMGSSGKPADGYDKRNMARDIHELLASLGYSRAHIVGHDIGAQVALAYVANYPGATSSVSFLDVSALPQSTRDLRLVPAKPLTGNFRRDFFLWWFAFNQVHGMPERLIEGRARIYQQWFWDSLLGVKDALTDRDKAVYAKAYDTRDGIRGGNGWYQAYATDLDDQRTYPHRLETPSLGIGGLGQDLLVATMREYFANPQIERLPGIGHYVAEEAPEKVVGLLAPFLDRVDKAAAASSSDVGSRHLQP